MTAPLPRCNDRNPTRDVICEREPHDSGTLHRSGLYVWGFRDTLPEWRRRMLASGLPLKDWTGTEAL